jgi:hypothetical protein
MRLDEKNTLIEWTRQWQEQGRRQGKSELLLLQAERKFGPLDNRDRARIELADADRLLCWGERLVAAHSLEEVFRG